MAQLNNALGVLVCLLYAARAVQSHEGGSSWPQEEESPTCRHLWSSPTPSILARTSACTIHTWFRGSATSLRCVPTFSPRRPPRHRPALSRPPKSTCAHVVSCSSLHGDSVSVDLLVKSCHPRPAAEQLDGAAQAPSRALRHESTTGNHSWACHVTFIVIAASGRSRSFITFRLQTRTTSDTSHTHAWGG